MRSVMLVVFLLVGACAHTSGQPLATSARVDSAVYYVQNHGQDGRHLEVIVADVLRTRGLNATGGSEAGRPADVTYLVVYEDRWQWDMRMYLISFTLEVRDAKTDQLLGFGETYQDSLAAMGLSHREVIVRAVNELLASD